MWATIHYSLGIGYFNTIFVYCNLLKLRQAKTLEADIPQLFDITRKAFPHQPLYKGFRPQYGWVSIIIEEAIVVTIAGTNIGSVVMPAVITVCVAGPQSSHF